MGGVSRCAGSACAGRASRTLARLPMLEARASFWLAEGRKMKINGVSEKYCALGLDVDEHWTSVDGKTRY